MDLQMVGNNIKKLRELKNFTQDYLAEKTGVARETIGKIEKGEPGVKLETIFKIATVLEVSITQLLDFDPKQFFYESNNNSLINGSNSQIHHQQPDLMSMLGKSFEMIQEQHLAIMSFLKKH
ncbi:helix-turn-helix domain-containing protein [Ferruginibacter sp.]|nr:helix-turn-helix transcriptional regulator [Ferruginibacter sp.]